MEHIWILGTRVQQTQVKMIDIYMEAESDIIVQLSQLLVHIHSFILIHIYFSVLTLLRKLVRALQEAKTSQLRCYTHSSTFSDCHVVYYSIAKSN